MSKRCPECGADAPDDAEHCAQCPYSFPPRPLETAGPTASGVRRRFSRAPLWVCVLPVLALLAAWRMACRAPAVGGAPPSYDAARDASRDLFDVLARAKVTRRRVLLEVGGSWCLRCRRLDLFFVANPDLAELRERRYVVLKVSVTPENPNAELLGRLPAIPGYPHLFVLDDEGKLLQSRDTTELQAGEDYDRERTRVFLESFAPQ